MSVINIKTFRILKNMVLVKPDPHYETYQRNGKDLGILVSNFEYEKGNRMSVKERHFSVTGTVYAVPDKIVCHTKAIAEITSKIPMSMSNDAVIIHDKSLLKQKENMMKDSVQYETDVELQVGDSIRYSYTAHQHAMLNGMELETDEGKMILMPYDKIFMVVDEDLYPKKMINGLVAVSEITNKDVVQEDGINVVRSESGIVVVNNNTKEVRKRKGMKVKCVLSGTPLRSYLSIPDYGADNTEDLLPGDDLLIDPRGKQKLEPHNHQHIEEEIFLIHRRQIILKSIGNFEEISLE